VCRGQRAREVNERKGKGQQGDGKGEEKEGKGR